MRVLSLTPRSCHLELAGGFTSSPDLGMCSVVRVCLLDKKVGLEVMPGYPLE